MVDPRNRALRPPIHRSWLRLRMGKAYYTGKRYLLWCSPKFRWAKNRSQVLLPNVRFRHATPLMRQLRGEDLELQRNKITNLRLAVDRLDGIVLAPGETFSYWKLIGKPSRRKGYLEGMVLERDSPPKRKPIARKKKKMGKRKNGKISTFIVPT